MSISYYVLRSKRFCKGFRHTVQMFWFFYNHCPIPHFLALNLKLRTNSIHFKTQFSHHLVSQTSWLFVIHGLTIVGSIVDSHLEWLCQISMSGQGKQCAGRLGIALSLTRTLPPKTLGDCACLFVGTQDNFLLAWPKKKVIRFWRQSGFLWINSGPPMIL